MDNVFEELDRLYEGNTQDLPTLLDIVRCSVPVLTNDVRNFTREDAEKVASYFNFDDEVDFEEDYEPVDLSASTSPLAGRSPDKFIVEPDEVREVIRKISANHVFVNTIERSHSGRQNVAFMNEHNLSEDDIRELAKQLELGDYSFSAPSRQPQFAGNILTFFITKKDFRLADGRTFDDLFVYVKVDTPAEGPVTAISFHRGSGSLRHPYEGQV